MAWCVFLLRYTQRLREAVGEFDDVLLLVALSMASTLNGVRADASEGFENTNGP
jgi:hypothetical protein